MLWHAFVIFYVRCLAFGSMELNGCKSSELCDGPTSEIRLHLPTSFIIPLVLQLRSGSMQEYQHCPNLEEVLLYFMSYVKDVIIFLTVVCCLKEVPLLVQNISGITIKNLKKKIVTTTSCVPSGSSVVECSAAL